MALTSLLRDLRGDRDVEDAGQPCRVHHLHQQTVLRGLVRLDHHGKLQYLGRADSQIKLRGYRIEAGEIEAALREHEDVGDAVVMMRGEQLADHHLEAYVVAQDNLDVSALLDHLRALGCDQAQGFHIARPMLRAELEALLETAPRW